MITASVLTVFVVTPRINAIAAAAGRPVVALPTTDSRRIEFGRWHGASNLLMLFTIVAGIGLLWAEAHDDGHTPARPRS
jgi:hypothetical protein